MEKDTRFFPALQMVGQAANGRFELVQGDILDIAEDELLDHYLGGPHAHGASWQQECNIAFVGNLPFGISTPLLFKWLRQLSSRTGAFRYGRVEMLLMFQKEVADVRPRPYVCGCGCVDVCVDV